MRRSGLEPLEPYPGYTTSHGDGDARLADVPFDLAMRTFE
jgi:hypothetical protein